MDFNLENPFAGVDEDVQHPFNTVLFSGSSSPNSLPALFAAELDHMSSFANNFDQISTRCQVLSLILQARISSNLDPEMAYLAINYIDRFLSKREIPCDQPWIARLLAFSCLSLASKMKRLDFTLANFQIEGGFIVDAQTIQRMELIVLSALDWRMRSITPFSFLRFFLSFFSPANPILIQAVKARASQILFKSQNEVKLLEFKPSVIAAAALLAATHDLFPANLPCFRSAVLSCEYLNQEKLAECCSLIDGCELKPGIQAAADGCDSMLTPVTVLGHQCDSSGSERTVGSKSDANKRRAAAAAGAGLPLFE
ncbi:Putative cyclin-D6-1 [Apostasia shenzhenica]|uniref:Cyclin-D6-1 n=1 Tax=Apostasia shenzhenica TaxID=1088818 RepID=A0A2H9ZXC6_9ASPA|nr:Putative cyclin-D6-1 [Apostasia shenzhenica]